MGLKILVHENAGNDVDCLVPGNIGIKCAGQIDSIWKINCRIDLASPKTVTVQKRRDSNFG